MCFGYLKGNCKLPRCKFLHPENGICFDFLQNEKCAQGDQCPMAHRSPTESEELLCRHARTCQMPECRFAHPTGDMQTAPDSAAPTNDVKTEDAPPASGAAKEEELEDVTTEAEPEEQVELVEHTVVGGGAGHTNDREEDSTFTEALL
jgi:hypothetical protein